LLSCGFGFACCSLLGGSEFFGDEVCGRGTGITKPLPKRAFVSSGVAFRIDIVVLLLGRERPWTL
jgi:hypothetical protein